MEHFTTRALEEGEVWRFYTIEEAEQHEKDCVNWKKVLEDFKKILGKTWVNRMEIRYLVEGVPVYKKYKIIGVEDNEAWGDYYWILEDEDGSKIYELANCSIFYEDILK